MLLKDFYTIVKTAVLDKTSFVSSVDLHKEHPIFEGHFPDFPVTPGVGMLQILKELTETHLHQSLFLESASQVKFLALVNPNDHQRLNFTITYSEEPQKIKIKNTTSFEDGTLVLKCNVNFAKR